ncbi:MAG: hypothetical protein CSA07_04175 [Bacteroidia bacterium]|nr:MAG: hypothetical protein CSA07_04175 [Bacteroidia bacterium]
MEELRKVSPFKVSQEETPHGLLTRLEAEFGVSHREAIPFDGKSLLASQVYHDNGLYDVVYSVVDTDGGVENFAEENGATPTLFLSPSGKAFVSIDPLDPDKNLEISIPLFGRSAIEMPKGERPSAGKFAGVYGNFAVLHDDFSNSWDDGKPDKIQLIEFKDEKIKKKHNKKIPLPKNSCLRISPEGMHLLARKGDGWLHRLIDAKASVVREREIAAGPEHFWHMLSASFEGASHILCESDGRVSIAEVQPDGSTKSIPLLDIGDEFYNVWPPVEIAKDTHVLRFTTEFSNGWLTVRGTQLVEFFYGKGVKGFKNLLTGELLEMGCERLVISGIARTQESSYALILYPMPEPGAKSQELLVLNRRGV